jgi:hypothetical protein
MISRAVQWVILLAGIWLLVSAVLGGRWGLIVIGLAVFASAFPPLRRPVDRMLVGTPYGEEADQAAIIRIGLGVLIVAIVVFFLP